MFKLEEICEELSQIQIPMRAEELESIGIHVEEEASAEEAERFQDGYLRDVHHCLAERRKSSCRAALVRPAATAAILEVDPVEAYLIWQFTDSWLPTLRKSIRKDTREMRVRFRRWKGYRKVSSVQGMPLNTTCPTGTPSQRQRRCLPAR